MSSCFFYNDAAPSEIYTLSLHDALPILWKHSEKPLYGSCWRVFLNHAVSYCSLRSEEHTSELQSLRHLVCRLLLEKKKPAGLADRVLGRDLAAVVLDEEQ